MEKKDKRGGIYDSADEIAKRMNKALKELKEEEEDEDKKEDYEYGYYDED